MNTRRVYEIMRHPPNNGACKSVPQIVISLGDEVSSRAICGLIMVPNPFGLAALERPVREPIQ
jgi:hypothetical protein